MKEHFREDIKYMLFCIHKIEEQLGWGKKEDWTNYHFTRLSELFAKKTGITLSVSSVRRIFGMDKTETFNPQIETKNALARYLGYDNWAELKEKNPLKRNLFISNSTGNKKKLRNIAMAMVVLSVSYFIMYTMISKRHPSIYYFDGRNLEGTAPHTIAIHYDISKMKGNDYYIDFGEYFHHPQRIPLPKNEHIITHTFYSSYYYLVKLLKNKEVLATQRVFVKSQGWDYGVFIDKQYYTLPPNLLSGKNSLYLSAEEIAESGVDTNTKYYTEFKNITDFKVSGDSCTFIASVKLNKNARARGCQDANIWLLGQHSDVCLKLTTQGCSSLVSFSVGNQIKSGKHEDLAKLADNLYAWNQVKIQIEKNIAKVYLNNIEAYSITYNHSIGNLYGMHFFFLGSGEADNIVLQSTESQIINESL